MLPMLSKLPLRSAACLCLVLFVNGTASAGVLFSLDPASTGAANFGIGDIAGLVAGDILTPFSFGNDPIVPNLNFTVDRQAVGAAGSAVNALSNPASAGGANGNIFYSGAGSGTNTVSISGAELGITPGFFGDDITGFKTQPQTNIVYFSLGPGSPTLGTLGASSADILMSGPAGLAIFAAAASLGLAAGDQLSGLMLLDAGQRGVLDPGVDTALFSLGAFSPDASTFGGTMDPGNVYITTLNGTNKVFRTAADLGILPNDQLEDLSAAPEPAPWLLLLGALVVLSLRRLSGWTRRALGVLLALASLSAPLPAAETCSTMAGNSPPVAGSNGTLLLPDLTTTNFRWVSNDAVFGAVDTGVIAATTFTNSNGTPPSIVFTGTNGGINFQGSVLLGAYQRGTMDLYTATKRVRYLITLPKVQVTNIKFDHKGPNANPTDGLNIRVNAATDLGHLGNGLGLGEWIKGTRNEPAAYIANQTVTIKVRFTSSTPLLLKADMSAIAKSGLLPNVSSTTVTFAAGVSNPEYVEMTLARPTDNKINKVSETWQWQMGNNNGCGTPVSQPDTSGPHTVYTVLAAPSTPWYVTASTEPWTTALDFLTDTVNLKGKTSVTDAAAAITQYLFASYGLRYDTFGGAPKYVLGYAGGDISSPVYNLTSFLVKGNGAVVNCYDMAGSVTSLSNLIGATAAYRYMQPFGYVTTSPLIGRGNSNNPFYGNPAANYNQAVSPPSTCSQDRVKQFPAAPGFPPGAAPPNVGYRSSFGNHAFVVLGGNVYDATSTPWVGTTTIANYVTGDIDTTQDQAPIRAALYPGAGACALGVTGTPLNVRAAGAMSVR